MTSRFASRRRRQLLVAGALVATLSLVAGPALAHGDEDGGKKDAKTSAKKAKKSKKHAEHDMSSMKTKNGVMRTAVGDIVVGALTGDSPCELSGPPASEGQVGKDAEGHNHRGPLVQKPLTKAEREQLIEQQKAARTVADKFPTVAAAEAGGYKKSTTFVPCIGAHYTNMALIGKFDPAAPSELLFDGTDPDSKIVGLSFLLLNRGGPPEGFAGPNDVWHQHNSNGGLCLNAQAVVVGNESTTPEDCKARGGRKVKLDDIWMVHDWVVPGWECSWGVFAGECAELGGRLGGTAFDEPDPKLFEKAGSPAKASKKSKKKHQHDHQD